MLHRTLPPPLRGMAREQRAVMRACAPMEYPPAPWMQTSATLSSMQGDAQADVLATHWKHGDAYAVHGWQCAGGRGLTACTIANQSSNCHRLGMQQEVGHRIRRQTGPCTSISSALVRDKLFWPCDELCSDAGRWWSSTSWGHPSRNMHDAKHSHTNMVPVVYPGTHAIRASMLHLHSF